MNFFGNSFYIQTVIMNFLEQQSQNSSLQDEELEKSHKLFQNYYQIKDSIKRRQIEKESSHKSIGSVQKAIQIEQQKNLQTRIALTQKQYSKARENNILLLKKLGEAEESLQFMRFELQKLRRQKQQDAMGYRDELQKMKLQLLSHQNQKDLHQKQLSTSEIMNLRSVLESRQKEIARLQLKINSLELQLRSQQSSLKSTLVQNEHYQKEIQELRLRAQTIKITEDSTGGQLLELQQSRIAIQRLVQLLKTTEEYRKFSTYAEQCKDILFLNQTQRSIKRGSFDFQTERRRISHYCKDQQIDERLLWVPTACYKALLEIKLRHETLNQVCIQQILFELNKIWLLREEMRVSKIKQQTNTQMNKLKRRNFQRYDQVIARKQIERLKKELQEFRMTKRSTNDDLQLLKNIGDYEDQIRLKDREIKLLTERIKLMEIQNNNYDKVLYLEGSLWVIDKILGQIQESCEDFRQFESKASSNYEQMSSKQSLSQFMKNCFELFNEVTNSFNDKLLVMKESILKKIGNNKLSFNESIGQIKTFA